MAKTSGQVDFRDYPKGMRAMFARTTNATTWDAGATKFDAGLTYWDTGALGARFTRRRVTPRLRHRPVFAPSTTWDSGATTWDNQSTLFDVAYVGDSPSDRYTENIERVNGWRNRWFSMGIWKRSRWHICALARGMRGFQLFLQCCYQQNVDADHLPISPCSRRVTDPDASPFDWTP